VERLLIKGYLCEQYIAEKILSVSQSSAEKTVKVQTATTLHYFSDGFLKNLVAGLL
jgi:hypothetical protein